MSVLEQMAAVDRLIRCPEELPSRAAADPLFAGVEPARLGAVGRVYRELLLARWWQPRFPALLAACPEPDTLAAAVVRSPRFEAAREEDVTGAAFVGAALDLLEAEDPQGLLPWPGGRELLAYEYLLTIGLPRRAAGEEVDAELEARLLDELTARWIEGGRLACPALVVGFSLPVSDLRERLLAGDELPGPEEVEPAPGDLIFVLEADGAVELDASWVVSDVLGMLAGGAGDDDIAAALAEQDGEAALGWLRELGLVAE